MRKNERGRMVPILLDWWPKLNVNLSSVAPAVDNRVYVVLWRGFNRAVQLINDAIADHIRNQR